MSQSALTTPGTPPWSFDLRGGDTLLVKLAGSWTMDAERPPIAELAAALEARPGVRRVIFDAEGLTDWDSSLVAFLIHTRGLCSSRGIEVDPTNSPPGVVKLLALASAVPERKSGRDAGHKPSWLARVGEVTLRLGQGSLESMDFIGQACLAVFQLFRGRARFRRSDFLLLLQECGAAALPIVTLISVLVGLILAFVGATQLRLFGAQIYVADLVGLGMAREMGAMMTAIIMAGRSGAAFAARLGTMQVNEEIDALRTLGISPMEFLVLPRMLALTLMVPLLCLYANFMGILGGALVGVGMLDLTVAEYFLETQRAISLMDFAGGLIKGAIFGTLVALSGCLRGMQCGRSSAAVGFATTSAVVTAIVAIVVSDALLTVIYNQLGI